MGKPVGEEVRWTVRDVCRAIRRGLGPASLKDSFDVEKLAPFVNYTREVCEWALGHPDAEVDMCLIAAWWMLREVEITAARPHHLYLTAETGELEAHLLVPVSKANSQGSLTVRTYACSCKVRTEPLCPYYAADRHLPLPAQRRWTHA